MSGSRALKSRSSRVDGKALDASSACPLTIEMATLRQRLLDRRRPGAHLAIKRLEKFDPPISDLKESAAKLDSGAWHNLHSADPMLRRLIFLKTNHMIGQLVDVMRHVANSNTVFELTVENTRLEPEDPESTKAYEEVCQGIHEDVQHERERFCHSKEVMFSVLDFMVEAHLRGELIKIE